MASAPSATCLPVCPQRHVSLLAAIQQHLDLALLQIPSWVKLRGVVTKYSQIEVDHVHAQESMSIPPLGMNMQSSAEAARDTGGRDEVGEGQYDSVDKRPTSSSSWAWALLGPPAYQGTSFPRGRPQQAHTHQVVDKFSEKMFVSQQVWGKPVLGPGGSLEMLFHERTLHKGKGQHESGWGRSLKFAQGDVSRTVRIDAGPLLKKIHGDSLAITRMPKALIYINSPERWGLSQDSEGYHSRPKLRSRQPILICGVWNIANEGEVLGEVMKGFVGEPGYEREDKSPERPTSRLNRPGHGNPARIQADVQRRKSDKNGPIDKHHPLEIRLLSFSTNQPHPLATQQPVIFIASISLILDLPSVRIEIVGDHLALHITFLLLRDASGDMFFLVVWIKGEVHCLRSSVWGAYAYSSFLTEDTLIIPNLLQNNPEIVRIVVDESDDDVPRLVPLCTLNLPPLSGHASRAITMEDRTPTLIIVHDFNPYTMCEAAQGRPQECADRDPREKSRVLPNGNRQTVKVEEDVIPAGYGFEGVLIDEERSLGLKTSKDDEIEISSFDVHVLGQFGVL
ncbi:hypothetical protein V8E53_008574 [Lactarius tabidus]